MKLLFLLLSVTLLCTCRPYKTSGLGIEKYSDTLIFPSNVSYNLFQYLQLGGEELLFFLNESDNSIDAFNLRTKQHSKTMPLDTRTYNDFDLGKVKSFFVYQFDSIFIQRLYSITLVNSRSKVLQEP